MKIIRLYLYLLCLLSCLTTQAQVINGRIIDSETERGISFAVIGQLNTSKGVSADIDGKFQWLYDANAKQVTIQALGYEKKQVDLSTFSISEVVIIRLKSAALNLQEISVYPKENPANAIIKAVIANKYKFNPAEQKHYLCQAYSKTYFTLSDELGNEDFYKQDTIRFREQKKFLDKQYLFFIESFSERKYKYKNISQEKILASRVSGFKSAPLASLASQLQSFTFYEDNIAILGIKYVNPLMSGTLKRYRFLIKDTLIQQTDTTILITFEPREKSNFKGLKGILYIYKNRYVMSNVIAEPAAANNKDNRVKIQQLYTPIDSVHWFPKQLNAEIIFGSVPISDGESKTASAVATKSVLKGLSKTYIDEVIFDTIFKIKNKNVEVLTQKGYEKIKESDWLKLRRDTLDSREKNTYRVLDSLGEKTKIERKLALYKVLLTGKIPLGYVDADLNRILKVNEVEGLRLGAGLSTSNKLSNWFTVGGFGGYGFRDKAWKYGGYAQINYLGKPDRFLKIEAFNDLSETAGTTFLTRPTEMAYTESIRDILITKMDKVGMARLSWQHVFFNAFKTQTYYSIAERNSPSGWLITDEVGNFLRYRNVYVTHETGLMLRWWPGEKFIESLGQIISLGSQWPIFYFNVGKGLTETVQGYTGQYDYTKFDLRIDGNVNFKVRGSFSYQLQASKLIGDVPYTLRYNNKGSRSESNRISVAKTFETMFLNEFISNEYAALFLCFNTGYFLKRNKICNPTIDICHNYGIGNLIQGRGRLTYVELNSMSKGFSEVGLRLNNLYRSNFSSFGVAAFYRYGNYVLEEPRRNLMIKLALSLSLN